MKYLNRFNTTQDFWTFIYDKGGTYGDYIPAVDLDTSRENVFYSGFDNKILSVPQGFVRLEYFSCLYSQPVVFQLTPSTLPIHKYEYSLIVKDTHVADGVKPYACYMFFMSKRQMVHNFDSSGTYGGHWLWNSNGSTYLCSTLWTDRFAHKTKLDFYYSNTLNSPTKWNVKAYNMEDNNAVLASTSKDVEAAFETYDSSNNTMLLLNNNTNPTGNAFQGKFYIFTIRRNSYINQNVNEAFSNYTYYPAKRLSDNKVGIIEFVVNYQNPRAISSYSYNFLTSLTAYDPTPGPINEPEWSGLVKED